MSSPALRDLVKSIGSKYTLVLAVAKRARQVVIEQEGDLLATEKPVTIAIDELRNGRIEIRNRSGSKE